MKEVLALIEKKKLEFAQTPFMKFLQDKSIDPRQRLAWAPAFAPFAMSFKDFNRFILRFEPATSKLQEMINQHTREDGRHWVWFLQDMKLMGYDYSMNFTDTLKFLWGEETQKVRSMAYDLFAICTFEDDILMKLAVIESIEATGNVALFEIAQVAKELQQITKLHHPYFGESHYAKETGHIQAEMDDVKHFVESIQLTEAQREKAFTLVEKVFADFTEAMNEMLEFAKKHPYNEPFTTTGNIKQSKIETTHAHLSDVVKTEPIHEALAAKALLPSEHIVDAGHVDGDLRPLQQAGSWSRCHWSCTSEYELAGQDSWRIR